MKMCGDCIYYPICGQWVEESETFPEIEGGCKVFKSKADFVEVVRCKDCRYFTEGMAIGMCKRIEDKPIIPCRFDHFCSYGERKANKKN